MQLVQITGESLEYQEISEFADTTRSSLGGLKIRAEGRILDC